MSLGRGPGHRPGGEQSLIIGVSVHEGQGRHSHILAHSHRSDEAGDRVASPAVRIAHVSDCYAPRTGGIETQVRSLARAQADAGHEVHVITATPGHGEVRSGTDSDGPVIVHRVAANLPAELPVHPRTGHHVRAICTDIEPGVVHVHTGVISPFAWGGLRVAAKLDIPRVVTVHSMWGVLSRTGFAATRWGLPWRGSVLSAVSSTAAAPIERSLSQPVAVLPNGIDPSLWPTTDRQPQSGRLSIVSVLRLAPRKRAAALVDIIAEAARRLGPDITVHATLIGDGPERARLQRHINSRGLNETIALLGRLAPAQIKDQFTVSDVFVQASVHESFGIAALEARTSGIPVVARAQTGAGEFIRNGVNGALADSDDGLIESLVRLAREPELLRAMRTYNIDNPPDQTWPEVLAIADALYSRAGA
jgi:glycosyltransferase involved in cell wall biosynthesis